MALNDWSTRLIEWADTHMLQLAVTLAVIVTYWLLDRISTPKLEQSADHSRFSAGFAGTAVRTARVLFGLVGLLIIAAAWGVNFNALLVFAATGLTFLGVALFASWSILSNITAYFVLLFQPNFRRGNFIRIIDADNIAEGYVAELSLINTRLITENREVLVYPNNLLLARPILVNPRDRIGTLGKIGPNPPTDAQ